MPHVCESICENAEVGDQVRYISTPEQTGTIIKKDIMRFCNLVVKFNAGPIFENETTKLLICYLGQTNDLEKIN